MSLNTIWKRKRQESPKPVSHWSITVWFFETIGSFVEDEYVDPNGRPACSFADSLSATNTIWHPRDWKDIHQDDKTILESITCDTCFKMYKDVMSKILKHRVYPEDVEDISKALSTGYSIKIPSK